MDIWFGVSQALKPCQKGLFMAIDMSAVSATRLHLQSSYFFPPLKI
jgi:hypothetical protein